MPLAEELTRLHGRHVEIHSEPGVGTAVQVFFSAARVSRDHAKRAG